MHSTRMADSRIYSNPTRRKYLSMLHIQDRISSHLFYSQAFSIPRKCFQGHPISQSKVNCKILGQTYVYASL